MRTFIATFLLAVLMLGCATMSYSVDLDEDCKKSKGIEVGYSGTSSGAKDLLEAARRDQEARAASKTADSAVERGVPMNLHSSRRVMDMSTGGYYGYGSYPYPVSDAVYASEMAVYQRYGRLPGLMEPVFVQNPERGFVRSGRVPCPTDRRPQSDEERLSCVEKTQRVVLDRVYRSR